VIPLCHLPKDASKTGDLCFADVNGLSKLQIGA
jgi:hypothetical protein